MKNPDDAAFEECLGRFETDVATATRCFYAMAAINHLASEDPTLVGLLNEAPDFWNLVQTSNQTTMFITLGRIFDQGKDVGFSLDKLIILAQKDRGIIFSRDRLSRRKRRRSADTHAWLDEYLKGMYVPSADDFRKLRRVVKQYRQKFDTVYRPIRTNVYAHGIATTASAMQFFAETSLADLKRIIRFLQRLNDGFWGLYWNGSNPIRRRPFPPMDIRQIANNRCWDVRGSDQQIIVGSTQKIMDRLRYIR